MKEQYYKKVMIESENDFPAVMNSYYCHNRHTGEMKVWLIGEGQYPQCIDWYLLPVPDNSPKRLSDEDYTHDFDNAEVGDIFINRNGERYVVTMIDIDEAGRRRFWEDNIPFETQVPAIHNMRTKQPFWRIVKKSPSSDVRDEIIAKQDAYIHYLKRAIHSESMLSNIIAKEQDKYDEELAKLKAGKETRKCDHCGSTWKGNERCPECFPI